MKSRRFSSIIAIGALASLTLVGCGSDDSGSEGTGGGETGTAAGESAITLVKDGTLTTCTHLSYKPFQFKDSDGTVVGFDVDLVDLVAEELGVTQEILDIEFAQITSGAVFAAKKCDLGAGATTITEERQKAILFSDPYFSATQALITTKDSGITDLSAMEGKRLAVQTDTTGQLYAEKQKDDNGYTYEMVIFDDLSTQLTGLMAGRADAAINDNGVVLDFAKENPETEVVKEFDTGEEYGIMTAKDDPNAEALMNTVNDVLAAAKEDGRYNEIYKKWFGTDAPSS